MMLTRRDIDDYTARKLIETLEYAVGNSRLYGEKYGSCLAGISEAGSSEKVMEEFAKLPFTTQEELRERGMDFLCVSQAEISRIVTLDTGGSTGAPKRIYFTEEDQQLTVDYFCRGMQLMVDSGDKVLILMPAKVPGSIGKLLARGLRAFGAEAVEYGLPDMKCGAPEADMRRTAENRRETAKLLKLMEREDITSVVALPTHMCMLAEALQSAVRQPADESEGISSCGSLPDAVSLKCVLLSAEYVSEEAVGLIENVFGCKVYEHYGMTEMGLGCAVSCGHGSGYHVREEDLYLEIIEPDTGRPARAGEYGEIVFTTLTRKGMPFIRYRTGDFSRWLTEPCSCGSPFKRLDKVGPRGLVKGYLRG